MVMLWRRRLFSAALFGKLAGCASLFGAVVCTATMVDNLDGHHGRVRLVSSSLAHDIVHHVSKVPTFIFILMLLGPRPTSTTCSHFVPSWYRASMTIFLQKLLLLLLYLLG